MGAYLRVKGFPRDRARDSMSVPVPGADERVPVVIITGFLGAGKTTVLNHVLANKQGARVGVLVNEFGSVDIDSQVRPGCLAGNAPVLPSTAERRRAIDAALPCYGCASVLLSDYDLTDPLLQLLPVPVLAGLRS